ncbi:MAG: peptidoglycan-binding protein [Acetobacter aceti]
MSPDFGIRRIGIAAAVLAVMVSVPHRQVLAQAQAQTQALSPPPAFLLIGDGRSSDAGGQLAACSENTHRLAQQLKQQGLSVFEVLNPTSVDLRVALMSFARHLDGKRPVISYCGYAAVQDGRIFVSGDGSANGQESNLLSQAVPAVSLLRVLDGQDGFVFLELHPQADQRQALSQMAPLLKSRMQGAGILSVTLAEMASADPVLDGLVSVMQPGWQWANVATFAHGVAPRPVFVPVQPQSPLSPPPSAPQTAPAQSMTVPSAPEQDSAKAEAPARIVPVPDTPAPSDASKSQPTSTTSDSGKETAKTPPVAAQKPVNRLKAAAAQKLALQRAKAQAAQAKAMRTVQVGLLARGVYLGSVNGMRTNETVNAIRKFQKSRNEPATGQLTSDQLSALTGAGN